MSTGLCCVVGINPRGKRVVFWNNVTREFAESVLRVTARATECLLLIEPAGQVRPRRRVTVRQSRRAKAVEALPSPPAAPLATPAAAILPEGEPLYRVLAVRERDGMRIEVGSSLTLRQANHRITLMPSRGWTPMIERQKCRADLPAE